MLLYNLWQNNNLELNSARSILDSTVSCDVTTLSQTSRGQLGKRERLGTKLTTSYISFLFLEMIDAKMIRDVATKYIYDRCPAVVGVGKCGLLDNREFKQRRF